MVIFKLNSSGSWLKIVLFVVVMNGMFNRFGWFKWSKSVVIGSVVIGSINVLFNFCVYLRIFILSFFYRIFV